MTTVTWGQQPATAAQRDALTQQFLNLPLSFEANHGQAVGEAQFLGRAVGYGVMFERDGVAFVLPGKKQQSIVQLSWVGANTAELRAEQPLAGRVNYMHGKDQKQWLTDVPTYARVRYQQLYKGVDAVYYGNQRQLEYDLTVAPGADVSGIVLHVSGAEELSIDKRGELVVATKGGELRQHLPTVYQQSGAKREPVAARYILRAGNEVGIALGNYDKTRALVIDPTLSYATYLGGSGDDFGYGIVVDGYGRAYVAGETRWGFPTKNAFQGNQPNDDAFVTKFSATGGGLIYSTYIGGSDTEGANGITVDRDGAAYITGSTSSSDFPTTAGAFQQSIAEAPDAFVTKLSASGSSLVWSTYLGGTWVDSGTAISIDSSHRVYVVGRTIESGGFPIVSCFSAHGGWGYITRFNADGKTLSYSCPFGGRGGVGGSYGAWPTAVFVDSNSQAYVTGSVGAELETTTGAYRTSLACDDPTDPDATPDAFVLKVAASGSSLIYGTYVGGCGTDQANGIFVNSSGQAYIAGYSLSTNFPTTTGAYQRTKPANTGTNSDYSGFVT
ncbi:MAG TPA: SBBP repeat-containing protein, partial [Terriglobales bacterium]|nr:SBBP repeat-containing protein [Terriglobales bacterium]